MRLIVPVAAIIGASTGSVAAQQAVPVVAGDTEVVWQAESSIGVSEGPVYDGAGGVWFVHAPCAPVPPNQCPELRTSLLRFDIESGETAVLQENANAVGLAFDEQGRLLATILRSSLSRRSRDQLEEVEVLADNWQGTPFFSPNDLVLDDSGGIYFTDLGGRQGNAVYYIDSSGELHQVNSGIPANNGIALSPDGTILYVAGQARSEIIAFDVTEDGSLQGQRVFATTPAMDPDGLTVDRFGNVYAAGSAFPPRNPNATPRENLRAAVMVWNSVGEEILTIEPPEGDQPANLTLVPPDGDMLYVTSGRGLYRVPLRFVGASE